MPRHRRPAARHKAPARLRRPRRAERADRARFSVRWVVVTPTFAVGLGVVIAAALASRVPGSVFRYNGPPDQGQPCAVKGCGSPGNGTLASARPGTLLLNPVLHHPAGSQSGASGGPAPAAGPGTSAPSSHDVIMQYRALHQEWNGNFIAEISFTSRTGQPLANWTLRVTYPGQITGVWAGQPLPHGTHSATVTSGQYPGSGGQVQILFSVSGRPGPPGSCTFDSQRCHYSVVSTG